MARGILKNRFTVLLVVLACSGIFFSVRGYLAAKDLKTSTSAGQLDDDDDSGDDGGDYSSDDEDEDDEGDVEEDEEEDDSDDDSGEIFDSGYTEGWADSDTLRVYGYGICKEKNVKPEVAKEKAKKAAVLNGQGKIVMLTGEVKKKATADGWIKEFSGIVKGAMIIWEWYDTDEREYHVVMEVSFDR